MSYDRFFGQARASVYNRFPESRWEGDVWASTRNTAISISRKRLFHTLEEVSDDPVAAPVAEVIRLDVFGGDSIPAIDLPETNPSKLLPLLDVPEPEEVIAAVSACVGNARYKFFRHLSVTELEELSLRCDEIPPEHRSEYMQELKGILAVTTKAAAFLDCDQRTKPVFRRVPERVGLIQSLHRIGRRVWATMKEYQS